VNETKRCYDTIMCGIQRSGLVPGDSYMMYNTIKKNSLR